MDLPKNDRRRNRKITRLFTRLLMTFFNVHFYLINRTNREDNDKVCHQIIQ